LGHIQKHWRSLIKGIFEIMEFKKQKIIINLQA